VASGGGGGGGGGAGMGGLLSQIQVKPFSSFSFLSLSLTFFVKFDALHLSLFLSFFIFFFF
jgi:hypothetical protein